MTRAVFVYGSLLRGQSAHFMLRRCRFLGTACTSPAFELVSLGAYPALVPGGDVPVTGEVYEVDDDTLAVLDDYEDCPRYYHRGQIRLEDGREVLAYMLRPEQVEGLPRVDCGDWRLAG